MAGDFTPPKPGFNGGRPSELTDILAEKIIRFLRKGNTRRAAAAHAGIHYSKLARWLSKGRAGEPGYSNFARRVEEATAEVESECVLRVRAGAPGWQGSAWWLERHPQTRHRWYRPVEGRLSQGAPVPADFDVSKLTDEELAQCIDGPKPARQGSGGT